VNESEQSVCQLQMIFSGRCFFARGCLVQKPFLNEGRIFAFIVILSPTKSGEESSGSLQDIVDKSVIVIFRESWILHFVQNDRQSNTASDYWR
jgi:hypothetical protein